MATKYKRPLPGPLTPREVQVAALLAKGLSNKLIGVALDISEDTARFHVNNTVAKLGAQTRTDAAVKFVVMRAIEAHPCEACCAKFKEFA